MKLLFVCNQGRHRSRTAEELFRNRFETRSAGLYSKQSLKEEDVEWADMIIVMEDFQRTEIGKRFPKAYLKKQVLSLEIPDIFSYNQPELIQFLENRLKEQLPAIVQTAA